MDEDEIIINKGLIEGARLFSYKLFEMPESKLWIITEHDRSATTALLSSEY